LQFEASPGKGEQDHISTRRLGMVLHACHPSYAWGGGKEDYFPDRLGQKVRSYLKNKNQKRLAAGPKGVSLASVRPWAQTKVPLYMCICFFQLVTFKMTFVRKNRKYMHKIKMTSILIEWPRIKLRLSWCLKSREK
jgi:hypothetical protein